MVSYQKMQFYNLLWAIILELQSTYALKKAKIGIGIMLLGNTQKC